MDYFICTLGIKVWYYLENSRNQNDNHSVTQLNGIYKENALSLFKSVVLIKLLTFLKLIMS